MTKPTQETPSSPFSGLPALASRSLLPILQAVLAEVRAAGVAQGKAEARAEFIEAQHAYAVEREVAKAIAQERAASAKAAADARLRADFGDAIDEALTKAHREADAPRPRSRWHGNGPAAAKEGAPPDDALLELLARLGITITDAELGAIGKMTDADLQVALRWAEATLESWMALPLPRCLVGIVPRTWKLPPKAAKIPAEDRAGAVDLGDVPASPA